MKFAQVVFRLAGGAGIVVLAPLYFLRERIGQDFPPAITHPEYYYGFVGLALAWQIVFLLIGSDPARYRPLMLLGVAEKTAYGIPALILAAMAQAPLPAAVSGSADLALGVLFAVAFWKTRNR